MGMQLNFGDHISRVPDFITIPNGYRADAQWARTRARSIANGTPSANVYFRSLAGGKSLSALLADSAIWVNYAYALPTMGASVGEFGYHEIGISYWSFRRGRWGILATLIHELAHLNGAPGRPSKAAEAALVHCGLGTYDELRTGIDNPNTPYDPTVEG